MRGARQWIKRTTFEGGETPHRTATVSRKGRRKRALLLVKKEGERFFHLLENRTRTKP